MNFFKKRTCLRYFRRKTASHFDENLFLDFEETRIWSSSFIIWVNTDSLDWKSSFEDDIRWLWSEHLLVNGFNERLLIPVHRQNDCSVASRWIVLQLEHGPWLKQIKLFFDVYPLQLKRDIAFNGMLRGRSVSNGYEIWRENLERRKMWCLII